MLTILFLLSSAFAFVPYDLQEIQQKRQQILSLRKMRMADQPPSIPASAYQRAATGKIATGVQARKGHAAKQGWGVAVFPIPIDRLWAGINDELQHTGLTPVSHTELLEGKPCAERRTILMVLPVPIFSDRWWVVENKTNPKLQKASNNQLRELSWHEIPLKRTVTLSEKTKKIIKGQQRVPFARGGWFLIKLDEKHTLGEYYSWADPGGKIPAGPASSFAAGEIKKTIQAMKNFSLRKNLRCFQ